MPDRRSLRRHQGVARRRRRGPRRRAGSTLGERLEPGQRAQQGGLAGAVRAEDAEHLARRDAERRAPARTSPRSTRPPDGRAPGVTACSRAGATGRAARPARHRHEEQHEGQGDGGVGVALQGEVDRERHGLGPAREVPRERDRRPELAERAGPAQHRARHQRRADQRQGDPPERRQPGRAEGGGGLLEAAVGAAERALDGDDEERHRHERLRDDDARGGERQRDPEPRSRYCPTTPRRPNASSSATPPTTGGSTSGRVTRARSTAAAAEPGPGQHPGQRYPEDQRQRPSLRWHRSATAAALRERHCSGGPQEARPRGPDSIAASGTSRNSAPISAGTASGQGTAERFRTCRRAGPVRSGPAHGLANPPAVEDGHAPPGRGRSRRRPGPRSGSPPWSARRSGRSSTR